ncbi:hypothetical protein SISNIDRAFT_456838 [Sistotremastrum niveocremeum HHB9708]|uniref:CCD97-like C-terminal domain-containing protein n=1 Tax=Sistotremastrum niveocremeum HHB9708 TaxID=1314777 RepID=A0A164S897_9AGAM|nr:hypothetical protein SISNIDRAFT_456838 [Sistotremastrum niveocremeum HHB9708]
MNVDESNKILRYLGLPQDSVPNPHDSPLDFLQQNLSYLPPHILNSLSSIIPPQQRTSIARIRNRRQKYTSTSPAEFAWANARQTWPLLWEGRERRGQEEASDERDWASHEFMATTEGRKPYVGKLADLLSEYEEEREAERVRDLRRARAEQEAMIPEEDEDTDSDDEPEVPPEPVDEEPLDVRKAEFEAMIRQRFVYGHLENADYDRIDWDDSWDGNYSESEEERWFDDEEES